MSILDRILKYIKAQRSRTTPVSTAPPQQQSTPIRNGTTFSFDEFEAPPPKKRVFASVVPDGFTAVLQIIEIAATIILAAASFFCCFPSKYHRRNVQQYRRQTIENSRSAVGAGVRTVKAYALR
ncbi:MAG: hypothetical protein E7451_02840 [Ruminococcaceae bacterium]|nr:hypothetical protein [Oscillospiraceae bacterium]